MAHRIDLRSDTVTLPTEAMRTAMAAADVGDDVYGEDPTVNRLQAMAAERLGKEAALFVPSGTMGNLAAILAVCGRGDEIILGDKSHTYLFEAGGVSSLGGIHTMAVPNLPDGSLDLDAVEAAIRPDNPHYPITRLICLENTHNVCGGTVLSEKYTHQAGELAHSHGLLLHIDGARIFNAAAALNVAAAKLVASADSITFCLSKGLSAPVGSLICGSEAFIGRVLRIRKQLGGGMRQVGVIAAAGIVALETMIERLKQDHARARRLAKFLGTLGTVELENPEPPTNMLFFRLAGSATVGPEELVERMAARGVIISSARAGRFRLVLHAGIDDADLDRVEAALGEILDGAK
jgi:threonine aldolase